MRPDPASLMLRGLPAMLCALAAGCVTYDTTPAPIYGQPAPWVYADPMPQEVVSVYVEPPLSQPPPILVGWAPPPMLVDIPPPMPFAGAVWIGGYWVWEGTWVWAAGRWMAPPWPYYTWVPPYYEHRDGRVVFVTGFWAAPGVVFVPPPLNIQITVVSARSGVVPGPAPIGPPGVFVPAPPGSRPGLIVPAPLGTPPAVVISAPPLVGPGMRVRAEGPPGRATHLSIVAPAGSTAGGRAFERSVPAQAHLAATLPPVVRALAPPPSSTRALPAFDPQRAPAPLPPPQPLRGLRRPEQPGRPLEPAMPVPRQMQPPERTLPREESPALRRLPERPDFRDRPEAPPPRGPAPQEAPVLPGPPMTPREVPRGRGETMPMPQGREVRPDVRPEIRPDMRPETRPEVRPDARPAPDRGSGERMLRGPRRDERDPDKDELERRRRQRQHGQPEQGDPVRQ